MTSHQSFYHPVLGKMSVKATESGIEVSSDLFTAQFELTPPSPASSWANQMPEVLLEQGLAIDSLPDYERHMSVFLQHKLSESGITGSDLAAACGVTKSTVSHWLNGRRALTAASQRKVTAALGLDQASFFIEFYAYVMKKEITHVHVIDN